MVSFISNSYVTKVLTAAISLLISITIIPYFLDLNFSLTLSHIQYSLSLP